MPAAAMKMTRRCIGRDAPFMALLPHKAETMALPLAVGFFRLISAWNYEGFNCFCVARSIAAARLLTLRCNDATEPRWPVSGRGERVRVPLPAELADRAVLRSRTL